MKGFEKIRCRANQWTLAKGQKIMHYGVPELLKGKGSIKDLPRQIFYDGFDSVMIVAGKTVSTNGLLDDLLEGMDRLHVKYVIFDGAAPNPTIDNVEEGVKMYLNNNCQAIVAVGGGSSMDCGKIIGARIGNPSKSVEKMGGIMKVTRKVPSFYAVPTTAGTGSEATIAAVIVNPETNHKYSVSDPKLLPKVAVLDPELTLSLPKSVTAATAMDALTHAVEAYTNRYGSKEAYAYAKRAVRLIFAYLPDAYKNGSDIKARENLLMASYYAGIAFTRNCVGNVHAAGHPLSGFYNLPHGKVMAAILPIVLRRYGASAEDRLAQLGNDVGLKGNSKQAVAKKFIKAIERMNEEMDIPKTFAEIKKSDIPKMADYAKAEANHVYPTPCLWEKEDFEAIYYSLASEI